MTQVLQLKPVTAEPVTAEPVTAEPVATVIEYLEAALEAAKSGDLRSVCIVGDLTENRTYTTFDTRDIPTFVGHLALIQHVMMAQWREGAE